MKLFETPKIQIEDIEILDVITTSGCENDEPQGCQYDLGL